MCMLYTNAHTQKYHKLTRQNTFRSLIDYEILFHRMLNYDYLMNHLFSVEKGLRFGLIDFFSLLFGSNQLE